MYNDIFIMIWIQNHKTRRKLYRADMCIFCALHKYWCTDTNVSKAPFNNINLIHTINAHESDNTKIVQAYLSKFLNYVWYLNRECIVFDERI